MSLTGRARTIIWREHCCDFCGDIFWDKREAVDALDLCYPCTYRADQYAIRSNELEMWGTNTRSALR